MWKISLCESRPRSREGAILYESLTHRKFEANHVSDALFEIITAVFSKELILSANFGRSGFGTPVWRATFKENVNVVDLKEICQCASARRLGCSRQLQMGWTHESVTLTLSSGVFGGLMFQTCAGARYCNNQFSYYSTVVPSKRAPNRRWALRRMSRNIYVLRE
jgi:hypothetical protein